MKDFATALNQAQEFTLERYACGGGYYLLVDNKVVCSFAGRGAILNFAEALIEQAENKYALHELQESA